MKPEMWQEPPIPTTDEQSIQNVLAFVSELTCDVSNPQFFPPIPSQLTQEKWNRNLEIAGRSLGLNTGNTELGDMYEIERTLAWYITKKTVSRLHKSSPVELQENHPWTTFSFRRPTPTRDTINIDLPVVGDPDNTMLEQFNLLTINQAILLAKTEGSYVYALTDIIEDAGLNVKTHTNTRIASLLRKKGIAVRRIAAPIGQKKGDKTYSSRRIFVFGDHYTRAFEALRNDPDFEKFRLRMNGGDK